MVKSARLAMVGVSAIAIALAGCGEKEASAPTAGDSAPSSTATADFPATLMRQLLDAKPGDVIELPEGKEMVMPGDNVSITVKLIAPIAMEEGLRFAIREGGRTVGAGVVAKILD